MWDKVIRLGLEANRRAIHQSNKRFWEVIFVMVRREHASLISQLLFPADLEAWTIKMMLEEGPVSVIVFKRLKPFLFPILLA